MIRKTPDFGRGFFHTYIIISFNQLLHYNIQTINEKVKCFFQIYTIYYKGVMNMYELKCSKCDTIKTYTNKRSWYNAKRRKVQCQPCQSKSNSEYFSGKKNPNYPTTRRQRNSKSEYFRNCPSCDDIIYYSSKTHLNQSTVK